ncbi:DUF1983 domain-containing protein, partial [Xenorhabdus sp. M]
AFYFRAQLVDKSGNPSPWTDFVRGESSTDTRWIVDAAGDQFLTAEAGKRIQADVDWNTESSLMLSNMQQTLSRDLMVRDGENKAQISELWAVRVTDKEATAQQLTEIRTNLGNTAADVITNKQAISDTQKAQAEKMDQVQAQLGDQKAMINTKMQAEFNQTGNGYAMHSTNITLRYNGQKYNAGGMVISGEVKNGQLESYIGFSANNFAFFNPVSGKPVPFMVVKNGQMFTNSLFIEDGSITNAKIGNYIQSRNYVANQSGWKIDKSGFAEFENIKARGEINATSGTFAGTLNGANGNFTGTIYANKIVGDVVSVTLGNASLGNNESIFFHKKLNEAMPFDRVFIYGPVMVQRYVGSLGGSGFTSVLVYINNDLMAEQRFSMEHSGKGPQCISGTLFTPPITIRANTTPTIKVVLSTQGPGTTYPTSGIGMLFKASSQWTNL